MIQEKEYEAFIGDNGMIVFAISAKPGELKDPKILYDGGDHALLYRSDEDIVVLDFLHPDIKNQMSHTSKALVAEIDYDKAAIVSDYVTHINQVFQMPIALDLKAES